MCQNILQTKTNCKDFDDGHFAFKYGSKKKTTIVPNLNNQSFLPYIKLHKKRNMVKKTSIVPNLDNQPSLIALYKYKNSYSIYR